MDTEVLGEAAPAARSSRPPRSSMGRTDRGRLEKLLKELRGRHWGFGSAAAGLAFLELVATHSSPPAPLNHSRDALMMALAPRLTARHRADQLRRAATLLARGASRDSWAQAAALILRAHAVSLDARPEARLELIQFCERAMGLAPSSVDTAIPRVALLLKPSGLPVAGFKELAVAQVQALCTAALLEVCARRPYAGWSMLDIDAALFALRHHYANAETTLCGETATVSQRQEDFRTLGLPLWDALRQAAIRLAAKPGSAPCRDDAWHQRTQAAVFLAIGAAKSATKADALAVPVQTEGPTRIICRRPIAPSAERIDREELERHRVLECPLPVATMPRRAALEAAHRRLLLEFPWAEDVLDAVFDDLLGRAAVGSAFLAMPPTLLVGHPGSGKSRLARRLADELGLPRLDLCLGGSADAKMLCGTSRGWSSGRPGDLATLLATQLSASAIVILDELDKAQGPLRNDVGIQAYLLGLVEPETAARHHDVFLKTECDFTGVLWLATANALSGIAPALLTRFRVLMVRQPRPQDLVVVARNVIEDMAERWGVDRQVLPGVEELDLPLDRLTSARQVRQATEGAIAHWARELQRH